MRIIDGSSVRKVSRARMLRTDGFDPRCRDAFLHAALPGRCESTGFAGDEDNPLSGSVRADVAALGSDNARCVLGVPQVS